MCNKDCQCINDILKIICILQKKSDVQEECLLTCDKEYLGPGISPCNYNTRPVQLFLNGKNGNEPLIMPTTRDPISATTKYSNVFRVEKVEDCCATFRVLKVCTKLDDQKEESSYNYYLPTNSFFTLDLHCVCAIRCLDDTYIECI